MAGITLKNVSKSFGNSVSALSELCLDIESRSRVAIVGPSGSGKSTLLRIIAGIETPSAGQLAVDKTDATPLKPNERNVGIVFQGENLLAHLTVGENLVLGCKLRRIDTTEAEARANAAADRLGVASLWDRMPNQLSGGEAQRVAIGRLLTTRPAIWLLDEPAAHVDPGIKQELIDCVLELQEETQATLVYVTHDQAEAMCIGERVAVLRDGRLEQFGTPTQLYREPQTSFVASFIGTPPSRLVRLELVDGRWKTPSSSTSLDLPISPPGTEVMLSIPSDAVTLEPQSEHAEIEATIKSTACLGHDTIVTLVTEAGWEITTRCEAELAPQHGTRVHVGLRLGRCSYFDPATGNRCESAVT